MVINKNLDLGGGKPSKTYWNNFIRVPKSKKSQGFRLNMLFY